MFELKTYFADLDEDSFTFGSTSSCGLPTGYVEVPSLLEDCDDNNESVNPNAIEVADDGIDQNCDGVDLVTPVGCTIGDVLVETVVPQLQCDALLSFFDATRGDLWGDNTGWNTATDPCGWNGLSCSDSGISGMFMAEFGLFGPIPVELSYITSLQNLDLSRNFMYGTFPAKLANLTNLQQLDLGFNSLGGVIPFELSYLTSLTYLDLGFNSFTQGVTPGDQSFLTSLSNVTSLTHLDLNNVWLREEIPAELGNLVNLEFLRLSGARLTGAIPAELGSLAKLQYLYLRDNNLSGDVSALGGLSDTITTSDQLDIGVRNGCFTSENITTAAWLDSVDPDWEFGCKDRIINVIVLGPDGPIK